MVAPYEIARKLALVTGAGSGIGKATALALAERGAGVLAVDIDLASAEKTAASCQELGAPVAHAHRLDVADAAGTAELADKLTMAHGALDILVVNAGVGMTGRFLDTTIEDWNWIRSINLDGMWNSLHAFGRPMVRKRQGRVTITSSGLGYTPRATEPAYVTTKAAVLALAECLRADWGRSGVSVSAICPGVINTPILDRARFVGDQDDPQARAKARKAFSRGHTPEMVATAIVEQALVKGKMVVPVGFEAKAGWWLSRFGPRWLRQVIARANPR